MACERCGRPANGRYCADCEREQGLVDYHGTPADVRERREAIEDGGGDE